MRLAVNVGFLFAELPYLERFLAVRAAGFEEVEFAWPTEPIEDVAGAVKDAGLGVALIGSLPAPRPPATWGTRMIRPRAIAGGLQFEAAMRLADELGCPTLSVFAGEPVGRRVDGDPAQHVPRKPRAGLCHARPRPGEP